MKNVYEIPAGDLNGELLVPKDLDGEPAAVRLSRSVLSNWAIKIVNDTDVELDAVELVSTSDDSRFDEFAEGDGIGPIPTGDVPENVRYVTKKIVGGYFGVELTADPAPTEGTVKVVFNTRRTGGA